MFLGLGLQQGAVIGAQNIAMMDNTQNGAIIGGGDHCQMFLT